jgi:hypothetical protein
MSRGRKKKPGKRHACGKRLRSETQHEAMSTVLEARQRHFQVTPRQARDERLGTALGRLAFREVITPDQYAAGEKFGELTHRHHVVFGLPLPNPSSVAGLLINEGIFGGSAPDPDQAFLEKLRRRYDRAISVLAECDRDRPNVMGRSPSVLIKAVVCIDEDASNLANVELRNLRAGLDALAEYFGITRNTGGSLVTRDHAAMRRT